MNSRLKKQNRKHIISMRKPTLFNTISHDVCNLIAPHLTVRDIKTLTETSTGTHVCFDNTLAFRKDAYIILQAVLNGSMDEVKSLLEEAKKVYGEDAWKLLVTPTYGKERHNNRRWEAETAICAAARSGNLYHYLYELARMPKNESAVLDQGKLYVAINSVGDWSSLNYVVVDLDGNPVKNYISENELGCRLNDHIDKQTGDLNLLALQKYLPVIMAILYQRGEANDVNPKNPEIASTYLLNLLFEYIPLEVSHNAYAQLRELQLSGSAMAPYVELVNEYDDYINKFENRTSYDRDAAWKNGVGKKHRLLPWFGLRIMCDKQDWEPMPNFNHLRAPAGEQRIFVNGFMVVLEDCLYNPNLYSYMRAPGGWGCCILVGLVRDVIRCFEEVKNMQLGAFITWRTLQAEKFLEDKNHSISLNRR